MINKRKLLFVSLPLLFVVLVIIALVKYHVDYNLTINVQPAKATVYIDGKKVSGRKLKVVPSEHTVSAKLDGFDEPSEKLNVGESGKTTVDLLLKPTSDKGREFIRSLNDKDRNQYEALGGSMYEKKASAIIQDNPLAQELPFVGNYFKVDYGISTNNPSDTSTIDIIVTCYGVGADKAALRWIQSKGYDPGKFNITYKGNCEGWVGD